MKQTKPKDAIDNLVVDFVMICIQVSFKFHELMEKTLYKLEIANPKWAESKFSISRKTHKDRKIERMRAQFYKDLEVP